MASTTLTWLGHATFLLTAPDGTRIVIDPWLQGNPACPDEFRTLDKCDLILITHGHFDHMGDAVELARISGAPVVANYEICSWLAGKGITNTCPMNKGGRQTVAGVTVKMTHAVHSSGISDGDTIVYGGEAGGFVVWMAGAPTLYFSGDTDLFGDMHLIGELHHPDVAVLPIGDHFTMSPEEAAVAVRLIGARTVVPAHFGTFPLLSGTPQQLREKTAEIHGLTVVDTTPGVAISL